MSKKFKDCCNEALIDFEKVKSKCKTLKEYDSQKVLIKTIHLDAKGHYQYYYIDCSSQPCKCYLLDIKNHVLHPELLKDLIEQLKDDINAEIKTISKKNKKKTNSPGM